MEAYWNLNEFMLLQAQITKILIMEADWNLNLLQFPDGALEYDS